MRALFVTSLTFCLAIIGLSADTGDAWDAAGQPVFDFVKDYPSTTVAAFVALAIIAFAFRHSLLALGGVYTSRHIQDHILKWCGQTAAFTASRVPANPNEDFRIRIMYVVGNQRPRVVYLYRQKAQGEQLLALSCGVRLSDVHAMYWRALDAENRTLIREAVEQNLLTKGIQYEMQDDGQISMYRVFGWRKGFSNTDLFEAIIDMVMAGRLTEVSYRQHLLPIDRMVRTSLKVKFGKLVGWMFPKLSE